MMKKQVAHVCSHTHWDREWYGSFQEFRFRLVRLIDRLMDLLERDADFRCFNLDGQTVVLEDYLEVRPEQRERLTGHIKSGRITIGPWYILPDEWLVSGESTVRNMLRGRAVCREFGVEPPNVGYLPDMFGHVSQMPQLLARFGFDNAIFWRGLSGDEWKNELMWESPDGSRVLAYHLPEYCGYCNAAFFYHSLPQESRTLAEEPLWSTVLTDSHPELVVAAIPSIIKRAAERSESGQLLLMNGVDHMEAQPALPGILAEAQRQNPDVEFRHTTFLEFMDALKANTPTDALQTVRGELRSTAVAPGSGGYVLPNILSSRNYLKQTNVACQHALEQWAEPFASLAAGLGREYPQGFLRTSWMWLLRNHPHDSIGGCSVDAVHRQMETVFEWSREIADTVTCNALQQIAEATDLSGLGEREAAFQLFNPWNWDVTDTIFVNIDIDAESGWFAKNGITINRENVQESLRHVELTTMDGGPVTFEILGVQFINQHRPWMDSFGPLYQTVRLRTALRVEALPALGYATYRIAAAKKFNRLADRRHVGTPGVMENEHVRVEFAPNGTLSVTCKHLGDRVLDGLHYFEDGGDNGDGYSYSPPRQDRIVTTLGGGARISRITDSKALQSVAVEYDLEIPEGLKSTHQERTGETVTMRIRSVFHLAAGSRRVDVETELVNPARNHRLRVAFPVPESGTTHESLMPFDIVERRNEVTQPTPELWIEDMPLEHATQGCVMYGPVALSCPGLPEYELAPARGEGSAAQLRLTLLRAVGYLAAGQHLNTIQSGAGPHIATPEAQMLGRRFVYRYSLIFHDEDGDTPSVVREALQHATDWRGVTSVAHGGTLPAAGCSMLRADGEGVMVSAVKRAEDTPDMIVRVWNAAPAPTVAVLRWHRRPVAVWRSDLAETRGDALPMAADGTVRVGLGVREIVTIGFAWE